MRLLSPLAAPRGGCTTFGVRYEDGLFLGVLERTDEVIVATDQGVVTAWAMRRKPPEERWQSDKVMAITATSLVPNPGEADARIRTCIRPGLQNEEDVPPPQGQEREQPTHRRVYLRRKDFDEHGYTEGCLGCRCLLEDRGQAQSHSARCRQRIEEALRQSDAGRLRLERAEARIGTSRGALAPAAGAASAGAAAAESPADDTAIAAAPTPGAEEAEQADEIAVRSCLADGALGKAWVPIEALEVAQDDPEEAAGQHAAEIEVLSLVGEWATDDVKGGPLVASKVRAAREEEMGYVRRRRVYAVTTRERAWAITGHAPIGVRWVDTDKGGGVCRSRLCAKEFNKGHMDGLFAGTPPLESLRALVCLLAAHGPGAPRRGQRE